MWRCLIVANQTLGGPELDRALRDRIARRHRDFFILVPMTAANFETSLWTLGFPLEGFPDLATAGIIDEENRRRDDALAESRQRAEQRLSLMLASVRDAGGLAAGAVGDADPVAAVRELLDREPFDEIIVSTLPAGISRWLGMDLPSRVARMTQAPVTTIEAEDNEGDGAEH